MKDWGMYQKKTYNNDVCDILVEFLDNYNIKSAIDLGCGSGNETVYMAKRGIRVLSIDRQLNKEFILNRLSDEEKENVSFLETSFEEIILPKMDLIAAFYSIPFCNPELFDDLWNTIYNAINEKGFFVGQLFGDRDDWNTSELINTFSIQEVKEYLKPYKVLKLDEVEYVRKTDNKKWHYYNIIAQKNI